MKCRFCKKQMLPLEDLTQASGNQKLGAMWECLLCPYNARQYELDSDWYAIMYYYNDSWYEVAQSSGPSFCIIKLGFTNDDKIIESQMILELDIDAGITPQNIEAKFPLLMVFG